MASRIEQIIEEIEEYVDSCKFQPLSTTKIVVNKEELEELLRELRLKTPDEIKRYQKIISNKDAILADAQAKADGIIANAETRAKELVSQHEVMQQAYAQANDTINKANQQAQGILDSATQDANNIRLSALTYTDEMLANIEVVAGATIQDAGIKYKAFIDALQGAYDTVKQNRMELSSQSSRPATPSDYYEEDEDEYEIEEDDDEYIDDEADDMDYEDDDE